MLIILELVNDYLSLSMLQRGEQIKQFIFLVLRRQYWDYNVLTYGLKHLNSNSGILFLNFFKLQKHLIFTMQQDILHHWADV